jgi:Ca2+-binding EF-hand superfamily protein
MAAEQVRQYDKDGNGSLDRSEVEQADEPLKAFDTVDLDGDDKILPSELETFYARRRAIERSRFSVRVDRGGDSLFAALDVNHDGRLGAREIAAATAQLLTCDTNADGRITPDEVPDRTVVQVRHGVLADRAMQNESSDMRPRRTLRGPVWFERMDTNGDGDLSPREFLGTVERFAEFDTNHDGFIDPQEAERAGTK